MVQSRAYDEVPYEDRPITETHPDRLWVFARAHGLLLTNPERMRVLELGCANAVNLLPMAFHLPEAEFVGMDLSVSQVHRACARVEELGIGNLRVECADVMDFDPGEDSYDLIIAHGLFSWIPDAGRDRVLALCRSALSPQGIAYISYNAMPAWGIRDAIGRAIHEMVRGVSNEGARVAKARAGLAQLAKVQPLAGTAEGHLLAAELDGLRDKPDAYLLDEYLVPSRAFWWREFVDLAAGAGLRVVGDVADTGLDAGEFSNLVAELGAITNDARGSEQLADIMSFRQFRATIVCRDDAPLHPVSASQWVPAMHIAARPSDAGPTRWSQPLGDIWPRDMPFSALHELVGGSPEDLSAALYDDYGRGRVQLRPRALPISTRTNVNSPSVSALSRFESAQLSFVTNPLHECAPLDAFHTALIRLLDGKRTVDQIAKALADEIIAGRLSFGGPHQPRRQLRLALRPTVKNSLALLAEAGLLHAD